MCYVCMYMFTYVCVSNKCFSFLLLQVSLTHASLSQSLQLLVTSIAPWVTDLRPFSCVCVCVCARAHTLKLRACIEEQNMYMLMYVCVPVCA